MRNLIYLIATVLALAAIAACGPSGKEVAQAKQARYQGDKLTLFGAVKVATEAKYKLQKSDEIALGMQTTGRWYSPEGLGVSATTDDERDLVDQSINMAMVVELLADGEAWVVSVRPLLARYVKGQPQPFPLELKDPSVPGWVHGKIDQLQFAIYEKLKAYEVKSVGGLAPAPTAPDPAPMPDEGAAPASTADPADPAAAPVDPAAAPQ